MKKIISVLSLSLIVSFTLMSGNVFGYEDRHLKKLKSTGNCKNCYLSDANLSNMNLSNADLSYADLEGANLSGSNLSGAILKGADLLRANLQGANLYNTDLGGANLTEANLKDVIKTEPVSPKEVEQKRKEEEKRIAQEKVEAEQKIKDDKKTELLAKKKGEEEELAVYYGLYQFLKMCYDNTKGQNRVWIKSSEMDEIKSNIKKIESKMVEEYPRLKSLKDTLWARASSELKKQGDLKGMMRKIGFEQGKQMCQEQRYNFDTIVQKKISYKPSEEVEEKDF